jgi:hypothetical protein
MFYLHSLLLFSIRVVDERLKHFDPKMIESIMAEIMETSSGNMIQWVRFT